MTKQQEVSQLSGVATVTPVRMSRRDKLNRLADLVERFGGDVFIFHQLEYMNEAQMAGTHHPMSAFSIAAADPMLSAEGLKGGSVLDAKQFFELSAAEMHEFSCDCGGAIDNQNMVSRIRGIADRA